VEGLLIKMSYQIFKRLWWRKDGGELVPHAGRKTVVRRGIPSSREARELCNKYNAELPANNKAGTKYEFTKEV